MLFPSFPFIITQNRDHYNKSSFFFTIIVLLWRTVEEILFSVVLIFLLFYWVLSLSNNGREYSWLPVQHHYNIIIAYPFLTNNTLHFGTMKTNISQTSHFAKNGRSFYDYDNKIAVFYAAGNNYLKHNLSNFYSWE